MLLNEPGWNGKSLTAGRGVSAFKLPVSHIVQNSPPMKGLKTHYSLLEPNIMDDLSFILDSV